MKGNYAERFVNHKKVVVLQREKEIGEIEPIKSIESGLEINQTEYVILWDVERGDVFKASTFRLCSLGIVLNKIKHKFSFKDKKTILPLMYYKNHGDLLIGYSMNIIKLKPKEVISIVGQSIDINEYISMDLHRSFSVNGVEDILSKIPCTLLDIERLETEIEKVSRKLKILGLPSIDGINEYRATTPERVHIGVFFTYPSLENEVDIVSIIEKFYLPVIVKNTLKKKDYKIEVKNYLCIKIIMENKEDIKDEFKRKSNVYDSLKYLS